MPSVGTEARRVSFDVRRRITVETSSPTEAPLEVTEEGEDVTEEGVPVIQTY